MNKESTKGIVLRRIEYGEADKIVTFLTPDKGKISAIARGVKKNKSKLAGAIELFSEIHIGYIKGKGDLSTLVSARLQNHYHNIVKDYDRVELAYFVLQTIDKLTEDDAENEYYDFVLTALKELDKHSNEVATIELWIKLTILKIYGQLPNLTHDGSGKKLGEAENYSFNAEDGCFQTSSVGNLSSNHIKVWRILATNTPSQSKKITDIEKYSQESLASIRAFFAQLPT